MNKGNGEKRKGEEEMKDNNDFKPYIPAEKITPEFTLSLIHI